VGFTIELDTGGTFTDGYVTGPRGTVRSKVDTTPHDLTEGILNCIDNAASALGLQRSAFLAETDVVRLSTTVGTNALINRSGAKVGLLLAKSLRDEFITRIPERLPIAKSLIEPLPAPGADAAAQTVQALRRLLDRGARVIVIALENGPDLAQREGAVREFIAAEYPRHYLGAVPVLPSHQVTLTPDPFVRIHTAVLDAYLHPLMARFLYRVEDELRKSGYRQPLLIAQSNGGTSRVAKTTAIRTWGSGPAGGVAGAAAMAERLGLETVVSLDVGGTSSDLSIIRSSRWTYAVEPSLDGVPVSLPVLELESIGIGGGSIARIVSGQLEVGPQSAGAQPGPAAFGLGGTEATVTDAACSLGLFDPEHFLGGRKKLDVAAARDVIKERVADPSGVSVETAALRILNRAASTIADYIVQQLKARALRIDRTVLFATGGAGGLFAGAVAAQARLAAAYAFPLSPVFSAFGLSCLDLLHTYEAAASGGELRASLEALKDRALRDMRGEGVDCGKVLFRLEAEVNGADGRVEAIDLGDAQDLSPALESAREYKDRLRLLRLKAMVPGRRGELPQAGVGEAYGTAIRDVFWAEGKRPSQLFDWDRLPAGARIAGPAIIESAETTVAVAPGESVEVGIHGEIKF
jgi:N-methylhydantoinase A/oxoprolinase/acetone carboxylase beta subunit